MTAPRHVDVGAYVLGIFDPPDEAAYEEHFAQCERCRREFIELADMPSVLDTLKPAAPEVTPPPLSALIDFSKLRQTDGAPTPAVPPQQRPNGATQPHRIPRPHRDGAPPRNGTARPRPEDAAPRNGVARPRTEGAPHRNDVARPPTEGAPHRNDVARPPTEGAPHRNDVARPLPSPPNERPRVNGNPLPPRSDRRPAPPAPGSAQHSTPAMRPAAPEPGSAQHSTPAMRPAAPAKPPVTPSKAKPRDTRPAGRAGGPRNRKPVWLSAAAAVLVALTVGVVVSLSSGEDPATQVADPGTSAPATPPSGAVAGAHVVSGTDPETGVTAIITIEPISGGTQVDLSLYAIDGPQRGRLVAVSRFGEREEVTAFDVPEGRAGRGEAIEVSGVVPFAQGDITRFEVHGNGIEPLLVVPT
ncbi:anti-sigma factor family protein [Actinophytocola gossypii]|uniref:Zinc-finger domain-containing protein n=1 Tax=Actinophytocola gossypii TaxID=2812003 RepID=A0ABT2J741_9PSEU|nr:hypothetical protein [Actinophytocola gossypii]MCT2583677.1 hypothetical protein [Actinophytocola gossypii]